MFRTVACPYIDKVLLFGKDVDLVVDDGLVHEARHEDD
jgi:hypothetical protein